MQRSIFSYILKYSLRQQAVVLCLTVVSLPFYYASLDLPKRIINQAIDADADKFPRAITALGREIGTLNQLQFLVALSLAFLVLVLINGAFKYIINVYKGQLGERMLRRMRYQLYGRILRFPLSHFRRVSQGEMVAIISNEVEPLGGFIGDAYSLPLYQGGLLLTALGFIFVQDPVMGLAVIALYPLQAAVIPRLQYQVNQLGKQRVREVRKLSNRVTESMDLVREMRLNDTMRYELAHFSQSLGRIFDIRYQIFRKKFFVKFLNNFLAQLTPFFFFLIGGYLVIRGEMTIGALVAVLAAYKDLAPPWKELLGYYQDQADARIRYEQIVARFDIPGLEPPDVDEESAEVPSAWQGDVALDAISHEENGVQLLGPINFEIASPEHVAIVGDANSGRDTLASALAGLMEPSRGSVKFAGRRLETLPVSFIGRHIAYVDSNPAFLTGSLFDNLVYPLKHDPPTLAGEKQVAVKALPKWQLEALASANSTDDANVDWIDYVAANADSNAELIERVLGALKVVDMQDALYEFGLRATINADREPQLAEWLLEMRNQIAQKFQESALASYIEPFDVAAYNNSLSVAENLLFGRPVGEVLDLRRLPSNRFIRSILKRTGLQHDLLTLGHRIATVIISENEKTNAPGGLPPIEFPADDQETARLRLIIGLAARSGPKELSRGDRRLLESIALRFVAAQHPFASIDDAFRSKVVAARRDLRRRMPMSLRSAVSFFDQRHYNSALSIRENIVFGEVAEDIPGAAVAVNAAIADVVDEHNGRMMLGRAGLQFYIGTGGSELTQVDRQRIAVARSLLKRPKLLILNDATADLDPDSEDRLLRNIRHATKDIVVICLLGDARPARAFDRLIELRRGAIYSDQRIQGEVSPQSTGE